MKKLILTLASCIALMLCLAGCSPSNEDMFLDALEQSVTSRMENSKDTESSTLVETELAYLDAYRDVEFNDPQIDRLAALYISGVDKQKEALEYYDTDTMFGYQHMWQRGTVKRYEALKTLYEEYGFMADNAEFIGMYVNGYDEQKNALDAILAIERDMEDQEADGTYSFEWNGYGPVQLTYKNNTDYSFTAIFKFNFYDKQGGTLLETTETWVDVKPNSTYVASGHYSNDAADWCYWTYYYDMDSF